MPPILLLLVLSSADVEKLSIWPPFHPYSLLHELERFPSREVCRDALAFNVRHRAWLDQQAILRPHLREQIADIRSECLRNYHAWDALYDAHGGDGGGEEYRQLWFGRLREMIGEAAWSQGLMPPAVPLGHFRLMR